jgi:hypothetical protein
MCGPNKYQVINRWLFLPWSKSPLAGQGIIFVKTSRSHSDTPHSVGLLWTNDQPDAKTSLWQHTSLTKTQTSTPSAGFEPIIPANDRAQTHALDRAAPGIGQEVTWRILNVATWRTSCTPLTVNGQDQNPLHHNQVTALKPSRPSVAFKYLSKESKRCWE